MTSRPDRAIGVAAGAAVATLLRGPTRIGTVIGSFSAATVIGVDTPAGPRIVTLLAPGASATPHGVRMPGPLSADHRPDHTGGRIVLGEGRVVRRGQEHRILRWWPTAVPAVTVVPAAVRVLDDGFRDAPIGVPRPRVDDLADALATGDPSPAVRALLGCGVGLTPGGDDVLAGLLVGLRAVGREGERASVAAALGADLPDRTTALSADLLRLAADGHAMTSVLALLAALNGPAADPRRIESAAAAVLAVGHTSGADLLTGLRQGLLRTRLLSTRQLSTRQLSTRLLSTRLPSTRLSARTGTRTPAPLPVPAGSRKDPS